MNVQKTTKTSKFLSYVLRHRPDEIDVTLDPAGWVGVDTLLAACGRHGKTITREQLEHVVSTNDKQRFELSADGTRIRARQGHSTHVDLGYEPVEPPELLYHGTARQNLESVRENGLIKGKRHHVHLSADPALALKVGQRHGKPVLLTVLAGRMHDAGIAFHVTGNAVWLTEHVAPEYLLLPDTSGDGNDGCAHAQ